MNLSVNGHNVFLIVIVTFLTSAILVPLAKKCAIHTNALNIWGFLIRLYVIC